MCAFREEFLKIGEFLVVFAPTPRGQGPLNSNFLFPFTHRCYKPNLVENGSKEEAKNVQNCDCDRHLPGQVEHFVKPSSANS
jgi:hypothetical protein